MEVVFLLGLTQVIHRNNETVYLRLGVEIERIDSGFGDGLAVLLSIAILLEGTDHAAHECGLEVLLTAPDCLRFLDRCRSY